MRFIQKAYACVLKNCMRVLAEGCPPRLLARDDCADPLMCRKTQRALNLRALLRMFFLTIRNVGGTAHLQQARWALGRLHRELNLIELNGTRSKTCT